MTRPLPAPTLVAGRWFVAVRLASGVELVLRGAEREAVEAELRRLTAPDRAADSSGLVLTHPHRRSDP